MLQLRIGLIISIGCRYSGILSAYGLALADVVHESQEPCAKIYEGKNVLIALVIGIFKASKTIYCIQQ